ncbi:MULTISPECIES: 16S rRNA (guanine(966)-N(2))-methyltransferase RsmD [unclassified Corynebacterium]|uniref:16S rRNA (guanine(966)-N(2))-methyltransferase RsmD n=1 Tax=unclassified Corynebacterium TaxID=2624378 RepID=UPI0030B57227
MTRIIAGEARGRRLVTPKGTDTRPTLDRAREAIFSSWSTRFGIEGTNVLDLFAGSGALGLEAASRGADQVTLVENSPKAIAAIRTNMQTVGHPRCHLAEMKVSTFLSGTPSQQFDRVIADPPYDLSGEAVTEMLEALRPFLADGAVVTIERHRDDEETVWPTGYDMLQQKLKRRIHGLARFDTAIFDAEQEATGEPSTSESEES